MRSLRGALAIWGGGRPYWVAWYRGTPILLLGGHDLPQATLNQARSFFPVTEAASQYLCRNLVHVE